MHVGHIRTTVIGDCLYRTLKFLGHKAISDNHLGDWGTQFGMIIYGYKHFLDRSGIRTKCGWRTGAAVSAGEYAGRLSRGSPAFVETGRKPASSTNNCSSGCRNRTSPAIRKPEKKAEKELRQAERDLHEARRDLRELQEKAAAIEADPLCRNWPTSMPISLKRCCAKRPNCTRGTPRTSASGSSSCRVSGRYRADLPTAGREVRCHAGRKFLSRPAWPRSLTISWQKDIARESDGAMCVFLDGFDTPLLIRKQDGAFLYATTDLATIQYRMETWQPDADSVRRRSSAEFALRAAVRHGSKYGVTPTLNLNTSASAPCWARRPAVQNPLRRHRGSVGLLDEGVSRALEIVSANDDAKPAGPELSAEERQRIAEAVGIGALKYADLSQNRTSDYVFDYDKMLAMTGNTATYMQYAHARIRGIFIKGQKQLGQNTDTARRSRSEEITLAHPAERSLAVACLQFSEALDLVLADYRPNQLTNYLFELANRFSTFYENCPVLKAETPEQLHSRLQLCDLTAKVLRQGLALLGIEVVDRM